MAGMKILVVDDSPSMSEFLKMLAEAEGYDVVVATNGTEGISKAASERPDLIITDFIMPEMDGLELTNKVRSNSELKDTPIIILSGKGRTEDVAKAIAAGANDFLKKPYQPNELLEKIKKVLTASG